MVVVMQLKILVSVLAIAHAEIIFVILLKLYLAQTALLISVEMVDAKFQRINSFVLRIARQIQTVETMCVIQKKHRSVVETVIHPNVEIECVIVLKMIFLALEIVLLILIVEMGFVTLMNQNLIALEIVI
jgi:hypothetical protein